MQFKKSTKFVFAFLAILSLVIVGLVDATPVPDETNESDLISFPVENMKRSMICSQCSVLNLLCLGSIDVDLIAFINLGLGGFCFQKGRLVFIVLRVQVNIPGSIDCFLDGKKLPDSDGKCVKANSGDCLILIPVKIKLDLLVGKRCILKIDAVVIADPILKLLIL
ncbi:hypothetical protein Glove_166g8 [Diversispora epigaea]|uniref:Uncharacterized protein n=1 Tax=Diversispora epigaea TaxID=1348612 RepID=A0A397IUB6_9GLOM|nr:hypothetical protein Glove_166g8 [Diversispora epigaea]